MRARRVSLGRSIALWCALAGAIWLDAHAAHPSVPVHTAFLGFLISAIVSAFAWLADKAVTIAVTIAQVSVMIGLALVEFGRLIAGVFLKSFGFLGRFWDHALKPFISWSWSQVQRLHDWLVRTFRPAIQFLERVRQHILALYAKWLRPIFDTIEITRHVLRVLETFHVQWALDLDRKLAELEDRLLRPIALALRKVNEAINWIDRIVDFDGLFQRLTFLATLVRDAEQSWSVLLHPQLAGVDPAQTAALKARPYAAIDGDALARELSDYYATGGGELAGAIDGTAKAWTASVSAG